MWWQALVLVVIALTGAGFALRGMGWLVRGRARRRLGDRAIVREARGRSMRVLVQGTNVFEGMSTTKANRTAGDLWLASDMLVVACNRGVLIEVSGSTAGTLTASKCTGPARLVLEGAVPVADGQPGLYRIEVQIDDAPGWASAIAPFVRRAV